MANTKTQSRKKRKIPKERRERTLYISLPIRIKSKEQVNKLFFGDFKVTLTRQTSRHCHVLFSSVEEKLKNLEALKDKTINGKRILAHSARKVIQKSTKMPRKKIVMPEIREDMKITQTLFIANIRCGTKIREIKEAFEGCVSAKLLKPYTPTLRSAIMKLESIKVAAEYLSKERQWPTVRGNKLKLKPDTRNKHKKKKSKVEKKVNTKKPDSDELNTSSDTLERSESDLQSSIDQPKERCAASTNWQISPIHIIDD